MDKSMIVQWLLTVTRRVARDSAHGRLPDPPTPRELGDAAVEAALGNLYLRERGSELSDEAADPVLWSVRP